MDERASRQSEEWLVKHVLRRTWWHTREGWSGTGTHRRRSWLRTLALGLVALVILTLGLVAGARTLEARGLLAWEPAFVETFEREAPFSFGWAIWIESPGNGIVLWPLVLVAGGVAAWRRKTLLALTFVVGFILLDVAIVAGWKTWPRARPDLVANGIASSGESFSSYPSGHVSQTIVVYGLLVSLWLRQTKLRGEKIFGWSIVALLTIAVAAGRTRLGAHWPSDLIAGAILGMFWLFVLRRALKHARE